MTGPPPPGTRDLAALAEDLAAIEDGLEATWARARALTEDQRNERVNDEWSMTETVRHCTFVIDIWLGKLIGGEDDPFHPIGLAPHFVPGGKLPGTSIDVDAKPTFDEAVEALNGRLATLRDFIVSSTDESLAREIGTHAKHVGGGLNVILDELSAHTLFANRDLDVIEAG